MGRIYGTRQRSCVTGQCWRAIMLNHLAGGGSELVKTVTMHALCRSWRSLPGGVAVSEEAVPFPEIDRLDDLILSAVGQSDVHPVLYPRGPRAPIIAGRDAPLFRSGSADASDRGRLGRTTKAIGGAGLAFGALLLTVVGACNGPSPCPQKAVTITFPPRGSSSCWPRTARFYRQ